MYDLHSRPELASPTLLVSLDGWIDAGLGAANATIRLLDEIDTETIATFDTDALFDHRARRPTMHLVNGVNTGLSWPKLEMRAGTDGSGKDLLALVGSEPDHVWTAFAQSVTELALGLGASMLVGFGAYPAPTPHTRPTLLAATASSAELSRSVGFVQGTIDVPAGVQAALELDFAQAGLPAIGLWAQVPHYASAMPYPAASVALLAGFEQLTGIHVEPGHLEREARATRSRLDTAVAASEEHQQLIRQLEQQADELSEQQGIAEATLGDLPVADLPTGDELAAELQRFLRDQRDD